MSRYSLAVIAESKYYVDYRNRCADALSKLGWLAQTRESFADTSSFSAVLVVGISFFRWPSFIRGQVRAGIQGEQLPLPGDSDWSLFRNLKRFGAMSGYYDLIFDWSPSNYLHASCSVPYRYLPFGSPKPSEYPKAEEWDVVFLGNPYGGKGRRQPMLRRLEGECRLCPIVEAWGEKKYQLLNSAKICLNLHQFESASFESPRMFELLSERAFVLSERIENSFPFEDGKHFVSFSNAEELISKARYFLDRPSDRRKIAEAGHDRARLFSQERMFELLSMDLQRAMERRSSEWGRRVRWANAFRMNLQIEALDAAAKLKNRMLRWEFVPHARVG